VSAAGALAYWLYLVLVFAPVLGLSTMVFGVLSVVLTFVLPPRTVGRLCGRSWARINAFMTPMRVAVEGRENLDPGRSYVIVSNHQSHYDVFVLYGWLDTDFRWVMKAELRRVPFLGAACARLGHVYIDRSDRQAALASLQAARDRITGGTSILFFPEGTRSRDGSLREFKKGAFRMALDLGLPILPLTVSGTRHILPPDTLDLRPGSARLVIHPPVPVDGLGPEDAEALAARVRRVIASELPETTPG